ncbi:PerC family transcriptional regulator [Escherichia coli]|nr:PerC family transcriptional regulator [Escherichia coli]EFL2065862.1 PerC family transcriptional regulator [Escherichia coli]
MVHDRIAEELEAKGFYRRASARWGEVMQLVETDKERHQVTMRRLECSRKAQRPPEPPTENYADLRNAVNRTYADMGLSKLAEKEYQNHTTQPEQSGFFASFEMVWRTTGFSSRSGIVTI